MKWKNVEGIELDRRGSEEIKQAMEWGPNGVDGTRM